MSSRRLGEGVARLRVPGECREIVGAEIGEPHSDLKLVPGGSPYESAWIFLWQYGNAKLMLVERHGDRRSLRTQIRAANAKGMDRQGAWANWSGLFLGLLIVIPRVAEILTGTPDGFVTAHWGPAAHWVEQIIYMIAGCFMAVTSGEALIYRYRRRLRPSSGDE
ncbi:hypothetical protein [Nonomuraea sp. NPDC049141]|uniref:hypothetical protein n=1 Tax=Nonomuraea sp. NPDC049141 TaxID=3155500 RepID=UPI0033FC8E14